MGASSNITGAVRIMRVRPLVPIPMSKAAAEETAYERTTTTQRRPVNTPTLVSWRQEGGRQRAEGRGPGTEGTLDMYSILGTP